MIVYGDRRREENPRHIIAELDAQSELLNPPRGAEQQRDLATSLLISSGELVQGLLDEQCYNAECDEWTPLAERCAALTVAAGECPVMAPVSPRQRSI